MTEAMDGNGALKFVTSGQGTHKLCADSKGLWTRNVVKDQIWEGRERL
jgi:hypothetical protein